ncbi:pyruvate dehydrogenase complex dihydrolipoamide acetyltransferase [Puniceibacterium sediminis]|uniref:Acetyltransferase component of pyruvate dehydrogenase complex n=1 Tax=Puniceibacterium sediminis TaxID=1608407 RepID=A0A238XP26_9RHOB|nr:pyruvate dehydrogenase complex dihydrolipoamide acetyltransferase [Puniceibacterium sediminis]SNR60735.1 pyruvate dehydrogenase E2 component (dihydrolipoamide acetyltransferase) [Puniceibacterium sediminis]
MPVEILMPTLSPTMEEGTLAKWLVKEGDRVTSGDVIAEIETDKATMEFEAVDEGILGALLVSEGTSGIKVNTPIATLLQEGESAAQPPVAKKPVPEAPPAAAVAQAQTEAPVPRAEGERILASPLARRIAAKRGIDLGQITGSGPSGRIVRADVTGAEATERPNTTTPEEEARVAMPMPPPAPTGASFDSVARLYVDRAYTEVTLDGMRKVIAARLTEAKQTIPHFYLRRSIRLDALLDLRKEINTQLAARGIKLSVNDFIIKACALALQQAPAANAVWAGDRILQLEPSDVAVAVAVRGGLFTPVLRDANTKSLSTLSAEMKDLASRARDRKLAPHEYQGGSFAISNLGMYGIESFDAVINPPHGAILAVGAGIRKPVVSVAGEIEVATVMSVTLSVDHRVIDGALGAQLLKAIVRNLEHPVTMLV